MTTYPFSFSAQEFNGKLLLITGGTKGIGAATVRRFQMSGANDESVIALASSEQRLLLTED